VQSQLPFDLVKWISDESRQEIQIRVPSKVDDIEREVHDFRRCLELEDIKTTNNNSEMWIKGWKKWEGEWIPRPIGV
jgi:hypothetical protein